MESGLYRVVWIVGSGKHIKSRTFKEHDFDAALRFYLLRTLDTEVERVDLSCDKSGRHDHDFDTLAAYLTGEE